MPIQTLTGYFPNSLSGLTIVGLIYGFSGSIYGLEGVISSDALLIPADIIKIVAPSSDLPSTAIQFIHQSTAIGVLVCIGLNILFSGLAKLMPAIATFLKELRENKKLDYDHEVELRKWDGKERRKDDL